MLAITIAWRFLRKNKAQTVLIVFAIAIAVSVQIFIGLLSKGLEKTLLNKIIGNAPHVSVYSHTGSINKWSDIIEKISKTDAEIKNVSPSIEYQAYIKLEKSMPQILIRGLLQDKNASIYDIQNKIYEGELPTRENQVLMGKDLRERLGLEVGDKIQIITINGTKTEVEITGFYDLEMTRINTSWIITDIKTAQNIIGCGDIVTSIEVSVKDVYDAERIGTSIKNSLSDDSLKIENWKEQNKLLVSAIIGQKICTLVIEFFVVLAAVLSIISILSINVMQKYKEIGILKAMGMENLSTGMVFFFQAFLLGVIGAAVGVALTMAFLKGFNKYVITTNGEPVVSVYLDYMFILKSISIDVLCAVFASFFPVVHSSRLSPVEVIKNG